MTLRRGITVGIGVLAAALAFATSAEAAGYVVNSTGDETDADPADTACATTDTGTCTLRAAIERPTGPAVPAPTRSPSR